MHLVRTEHLVNLVDLVHPGWIDLGHLVVLVDPGDLGHLDFPEVLEDPEFLGDPELLEFLVRLDYPEPLD